MQDIEDMLSEAKGKSIISSLKSMFKSIISPFQKLLKLAGKMTLLDAIKKAFNKYISMFRKSNYGELKGILFVFSQIIIIPIIVLMSFMNDECKKSFVHSIKNQYVLLLNKLDEYTGYRKIFKFVISFFVERYLNLLSTLGALPQRDKDFIMTILEEHKDSKTGLKKALVKYSIEELGILKDKIKNNIFGRFNKNNMEYYDQVKKARQEMSEQLIESWDMKTGLITAALILFTGKLFQFIYTNTRCLKDSSFVFDIKRANQEFAANIKAKKKEIESMKVSYVSEM